MKCRYRDLLVFDLTAFTVHRASFRDVVQLFACDTVTWVLNWCKKNSECVIRLHVTLCGLWDVVKVQELTNLSAMISLRSLSY